MNRKTKLVTMTIACIGGLGSSLTLALPMPNTEGDYRIPNMRGNAHRNWVVVDPDPNGLNCRMAKAFQPYSLDASNAPKELHQHHKHDISEWPVIVQFQQGQRLRATTGHLGQQIMLLDSSDRPWLPISLKATKNSCFVRANSQFIQPLKEDPETLQPLE